MNLYEVKTNEQYGSIISINADFYSIDGSTLDFYIYGEDRVTEKIASFWNMEWKYVQKVVEVEEYE